MSLFFMKIYGNSLYNFKSNAVWKDTVEGSILKKMRARYVGYDGAVRWVRHGTAR